jgi:3-(3-hydroxy-phenyl)propionate hydroxylase
VTTAKEFGKIIGELDAAAAAARDERLRAELKSGTAQTIRQKFIPDLAGGIIASGAKAAGSLFVQPSIRRAGGNAARLDDLLAPEFAIVTANRDVMNWMSAASIKIWQKLNGQRVVIGTRAIDAETDDVLVFVETERLFADWMQSNAIKAVIVRPDRYVFAGARTAGDLNACIGQLAGSLF